MKFLVLTLLIITLNAWAERKECARKIRGISNFTLLDEMRKLSDQLEERLSPSPSIFSRGLSPDRELDAYTSLMSKPTPNGRERSHFGKVHAYLQSEAVTSPQWLRPWISVALEDARARLGDAKDDIIDDFRNLETLRALIPAFSGLLAVPERKNMTLPDQVARPIVFPKIPDAYVPRNRDLPPELPEDEPKLVAWTNIRGVMYFKAKDYNFIRRGSQSPLAVAELPGQVESTPQFRDTGKYLHVDPLGATEIELLVPAGYVPLPLSFSEARLERRAHGSFYLHSDGRSVDLPLVRDHRPLTQEQIDFLTQPVGVKMQEWPEEFQTLLRSLENSDCRTRLSRVENYLRARDFTRLGSLERDLVKALYGGKIQCHFADLIMAAVARDIFHLPTRISAGFVAVSREGDGKSYVRLPDLAHSWIEVYLDGEWVIFDPAPKDLPRPARAPNNDLSAEKFFENRSKLAPTESEPPPEIDRSVPRDTDIKRKAENELQSEAKTYADRARRLLLRQILDPRVNAKDALQWLAQARGRAANVFQGQPSEVLATNADHLLRLKQDALPDALFNLSRVFNQQPLEQTFSALANAESRLAFFIGLLDPTERPRFNQRLGELRGLKKSMANFAEERSDVDGAKLFLRELPPIARQILEDRYGVDLKALSDDLASGALEQYALMRKLNSFVDFVMEGAPARLARDLNLPMRDPRYASGPDWTPVTDLSRVREGLPLNPFESRFANFAKNQLLEPGRRRVTRVRDPGKVFRRSALTVGVYDSTTSLRDFELLLGAFVATFTDRAISDVDEDGELRHRMALIGFDKVAHEPREIFDVEHARDFIANVPELLTNSGEVTNIIGALQAAVAYAKNMMAGGVPLATIEIVLFTDGRNTGGEPVTKQSVREALKIEDSVYVPLTVIALKSENQSLRDVAAHNRFYSYNRLQRLSQSNDEAPKLNYDKQLFTTAGPESLPADFKMRLRALAQNLLNDFSAYDRATQPRAEHEWRSELRKPDPRTTARHGPNFEREVTRLRTLLVKNPAFKDPRVVRFIFEDFLARVRELSGFPLEELDLKEQLALSQLMEEVLIYAREH